MTYEKGYSITQRVFERGQSLSTLYCFESQIITDRKCFVTEVFKFDQDLVSASIRLFFCSEEFASALAIFWVVDDPFGGRGMLVGVNGNFRQAHALKFACERFYVNKMSISQMVVIGFLV